jgi:FkbM family methyltransferase
VNGRDPRGAAAARGRALGFAALRVAVEARRAFRRRRCIVFERLGSARYSRTALYDLEAKLEPYLPDRGIFVEAGANDGYRKSNTYYLERFAGWSGVLVEPIPVLAARCRRNRPGSQVFQCALVGSSHPTSEVVMTHADLFSEVVEEGRPPPEHVPRWYKRYEVAVPARTLSDVLAEAGVAHVDFLSLDLQGFEPAALSGLDFDRWAPKIMLIEIVDDVESHRVEALLGPRYERVARLTPHDVLYRHRDTQQTLRQRPVRRTPDDAGSSSPPPSAGAA